VGPFLNLLGAVLCLAGAVGTSVVLYEDPTISPAVLWCTIVGAVGCAFWVLSAVIGWIKD